MKTDTEYEQQLCELTYEIHKYKKAIVDSGLDYYDFNLVKPDLFSICPEYLSNFEHLNKTGSEVFCNAFSKFVLSREAGEDMSQYFYSEDAYMESVKDIVASYLPGYDNR